MRGNRIENCPDLDITQKEIAFQEAEKRENIKSNEKVPVIFGKISRWFADLGSHLEDKFIHVTENEREKWDKATQVSFSQNLTTGTRVGTISIDGKEYDLYCETNTDTNTDTKNTAGSTNSNSKLFLVGAAAQTENSKTYSRDSAYIGTDGYLYSNNAKTLTVGDISQSEAVTLAGRKVLDAVEKNAAVPGTLAHQISQANSNLSNKFKTVTLINVSTHNADTIHTPLVEIGKFKYFVPIIGWSYAPLVAKQGNSIKASISVYDIESGTYVIRACSFDILSSGKVKIIATQCNLNRDGSFGSFIHTTNDGYGLIGIQT